MKRISLLTTFIFQSRISWKARRRQLVSICAAVKIPEKAARVQSKRIVMIDPKSQILHLIHENRKFAIERQNMERKRATYEMKDKQSTSTRDRAYIRRVLSGNRSNDHSVESKLIHQEPTQIRLRPPPTDEADIFHNVNTPPYLS